MQAFLNRTGFVSLVRIFAVVVVAFALLAPASAFAEEAAAPPATTSTTAPGTDTAGTAADTTTPTTTTTTTTTSGSAEGGKAETDDTLIASLFIAFAAIAIVVLFGYLSWAQDKFFSSAREMFGKTGVTPVPERIHTFPAEVLGLAPGSSPVEIKGPTSVTVGQPATFSALQDDKAVSVDWTVAPADSASPASITGESITFQASKPVVLTVTAKTETGEGSFQVTAVAAESSRPSLPFVGENYGAALIAIVAVAGVTVLGLTEAIKGEAIATFFGALLGYAFGKTVQGSGSGTTTSPSSGSDPQE